MRRLIMLILGGCFFLCGFVFARDATKAVPEPAAVPAKVVRKETRMSATGKVTELSDTMLKIDRPVKESTEVMEFSLEKTSSNISAGDKVKVSYVNKDGKNVATKVIKMPDKVKKHQAKKEAAAKEKAVKPAEEPAKVAEK